MTEQAQTVDREIVHQAQMLMTWYRGKSMKLVGATIHKCGEKTTRIQPELVDKMIAAGLMTRTMVGVKIRCEAVAKARKEIAMK